MKRTIQLGSASLNGTFYLSPHEDICTIALINIHYLYTIPWLQVSMPEAATRTNVNHFHISNMEETWLKPCNSHEC